MMHRFVTVLVCAVILAACSKKENSAEQAAVDPALKNSAQGTFAAELPAADSPGRVLTLTLNGDNSASLSVDYQNGEPAVVQAGTWTINSISNNVDVTLAKAPSGTETEIMSFAMTADTLALTNWMDLNYGQAGLKLVRAPAGAERQAP